MDSYARISKRGLVFCVSSFFAGVIVSLGLSYRVFHMPLEEKYSEQAAEIAALNKTNGQLSQNTQDLKSANQDLSQRLAAARQAMQQSDESALETLLAGSDKLFALEKDRILVHDGDTIKYNLSDDKSLPMWVTIRLAGIDTPELNYYGKKGNDQFGIGEFSHINYGLKAKQYLEMLIAAGTTLSLSSAGPGLFGRTAAYLTIDGKFAAVEIINQGLAYTSITPEQRRRFPEPAREIEEAARTSPNNPNFIHPDEWRRQQRGPGKPYITNGR